MDYAMVIPIINVLIILFSAGFLVYRDARCRKSSSATVWGMFSAIFIPILLVYLLCRERIGSRNKQLQASEKTVMVACFTGVFAFIVGFIVSPPDPISLSYNILISYIPGVLIGYAIVNLY